MAATWTPLWTRSVRSTQIATEAAPTLATEGMLVTGVIAVALAVHAPQGQTFTGSGYMRGYSYHGILGLWLPQGDADRDLVWRAGLADALFPSIPVDQAAGRIAWICDGVGLSGGTTITLEMLAYGPGGEL